MRAQQTLALKTLKDGSDELKSQLERTVRLHKTCVNAKSLGPKRTGRVLIEVEVIDGLLNELVTVGANRKKDQKRIAEDLRSCRKRLENICD